MKDYKKILEGIVNIINNTGKSDIGFTNICNYIDESCPELNIEDKIMKELIYNIIVSTDYTPSSKEIFSIYGKTKEDALAWLEKQGKKVEPKQNWSEDDEAHFDSIIKRLEGMCKPGVNFIATRFSVSKDKDWLRYLKEKNQ